METEKQDKMMFIFTSTFFQFVEKGNPKKRNIYYTHALLLYFFYYKEAERHKRNSLWATKIFTMNGTNLSVRELKGARKLLEEMGLITPYKYSKKHNKYYFTIIVKLSCNELDESLENEQNSEITPCTKRTPVPHVQNVPPNNVPVITPIVPVNNLSFILKAKRSSTSSNKKTILVKKEVNVDPKLNKIIVKKKTTAPKIVKKENKVKNVDLNSLTTDPHVKKKKVAGYKYTLADGQLYRSLLALGATEHRPPNGGEASNAYFETMDRIHELLTKSIKNPYSGSKSVAEEYKLKVWEQEEVIDAFKYYMSIVDKNKIMYKNIATFIFASYNGTRSWSPLVKFFVDMNQDNGTTLEGDAKKFHSELERLHIDKFFDAKAINRMIRLMDVICSGYVPNPRFRHIYFDNTIFAFTEYIEPKLRINTFKPGYIQSEKFIQQFFDEYASREILIPENGATL